MSKLPLLGVICNRRAHDGGTHQSVNHTYLDAISAWMNVQPLLIPANRTFTDAQAADNLLSAIDGLLVTGNRSNVHPKNYGGTELHIGLGSNHDLSLLTSKKDTIGVEFLFPIFQDKNNLQMETSYQIVVGFNRSF